MNYLVASCNSTSQKSLSLGSRSSVHPVELTCSVAKKCKEVETQSQVLPQSRPSSGGARSAVSQPLLFLKALFTICSSNGWQICIRGIQQLFQSQLALKVNYRSAKGYRVNYWGAPSPSADSSTRFFFPAPSLGRVAI